MIEYRQSELTDGIADGLVIEIDCLGRFNRQTEQACWLRFPKIMPLAKQAFDLGQLDPGRVISFDSDGLSPRKIYLLPTKVHPRGDVHPRWLLSATGDLLEQCLRDGMKSLIIARTEEDRDRTWPEVKLSLLKSFSRVPEIKLSVWQPSHVSGLRSVTIFADGGVKPLTGIGGFGVVLRSGTHVKEISDCFRQTNNVRMELMAAVTGLEALKTCCAVRLHSDSRYVVDRVNEGWLFRTAKKGWELRKVSHSDLWERFLTVFLRHDVEIVWVKGHSGVEDNERCDQLATEAMNQVPAKVDDGFVDASSLHLNESSSVPRTSKKAATKTRSNPQSSGSAKVVSRAPGERGKPKKIGDPCRHCATPLVRREPKKQKKDAAYHYAWYLYCSKCYRMYHVEAAKIDGEAC